MWQQDGLGKMPWLDTYLREYDLDSNPVAAFVAECFEVTESPEEFAPVDKVWDMYRAYEVENALRSRGRRTFNAAMEERGYKRGRYPARGGPVRWWGLRPRVVSTPPGV